MVYHKYLKGASSTKTCSLMRWRYHGAIKKLDVEMTAKHILRPENESAKS
jgi:hypothetical protein